MKCRWSTRLIRMEAFGLCVEGSHHNSPRRPVTSRCFGKLFHRRRYSGPFPTFGAGGSREPNDVVWGDAYRITADGFTSARGMIEQDAITDVNGNPLLVNNTDYSIRARVKRSPNLSAGTLRINIYSPSHGQLGTGLAINAPQAITTYQEFVADLLSPQTALPSDLTLRVYADGVPAPLGESFLVDNIEIFPTNAAQNSSLVRASGTEEPEAYDGVTGIMNVAENNGQGVRAAFILRNNLYFVKEAQFLCDGY